MTLPLSGLGFMMAWWWLPAWAGRSAGAWIIAAR